MIHLMLYNLVEEVNIVEDKWYKQPVSYIIIVIMILQAIIALSRCGNSDGGIIDGDKHSPSITITDYTDYVSYGNYLTINIKGDRWEKYHIELKACETDDDVTDDFVGEKEVNTDFLGKAEFKLQSKVQSYYGYECYPVIYNEDDKTVSVADAYITLQE